VLFFVVCGVLSVAPGVPDRYRPVDLTSFTEVEAVAQRVLRKPRMTFAQLAPEPEGLDEEEESFAVDDPVGDEPGVDAEKIALDTPPQDEPSPGAVPRRLRDRSPAKATKKVAYLRKLSKTLEAPGASVENPCVRFDEKGCTQTALDPFFATLDAVDARESGAISTVVTLGNSLIASDHVTDVVRARLAHRFGDGGRGFLLPDRLSKVAGRRVRFFNDTATTEIYTFAQKPPKRSEFGFAGSMHESTKADDRITWKLKGAASARLFWLDHEGAAPFRLEVDGQPLSTVEPQRPEEPTDRIVDVELPPGGKSLVLTAAGPGVVLYGVALERAEPGVVWDTIGVPASDAAMYVSTDAELFGRQLAAREPSLTVVMIGGNEIRSLAYGWTTLDDVRASYSALIDRIQRTVPDAACLAVAPIDAAKATAAGAELTTRPEVFDIVNMEREVAREKGCAFFDLFQAMGGDGSLQRFHRAGLVNDDLVHPKGRGGDVMGNLVADALLQSYRETPLPRQQVRHKRRLVKPRLLALEFPRAEGDLAAPGAPHPFAPFFAKLRRVETKKRGRVGIGQIGGSHVAAQVMPDRLRERLTSRFGAGGRGWVAVGPDEARLLPSGVRRRLSGAAEIQDGRRVTFGGAMNMQGEKARMLPGARFDISFCATCRDAGYGPRGALDLTWLYTPDMGVADIFVNDVQVSQISPASRRRESDVQRLRIPVRGEKHTLTVQVRRAENPGELEGPVNLFGVAAELARPGVVVDAVGLPGTTAMTMQRWRQDLIAEQVSMRDYDLLLLTWGANEAGLGDLDEVTYRHHLEKTVATLTAAAPDASCLLFGPTDRLVGPPNGRGPAPQHELVERVQRETAAAFGCGYFAAQQAMGGQGAMNRWIEQGLAHADGVHLTLEGYQKISDLLLEDLLSVYAYEMEKAEQDALDSDGPPVAGTDESKDTQPAGAGRSG
jgi:lysophospholipase L1-like esterase